MHTTHDKQTVATLPEKGELRESCCPSEMGIMRMAENLLNNGATGSHDRIDSIIQAMEHIDHDTADMMFLDVIYNDTTGYRLPCTAKDMLVALYLRARTGYMPIIDTPI